MLFNKTVAHNDKLKKREMIVNITTNNSSHPLLQMMQSYSKLVWSECSQDNNNNNKIVCCKTSTMTCNIDIQPSLLNRPKQE